ncbi:serine/threonine-protein kinase [Actinomycetospora sp. C-140]
MSPAAADATGPRRIVGRYRLEHELGRGAMGTVWSAYDEVLHRPVAVKEVRLSSVPVNERAIVRERTLREARATAMLSHPNVVTLYDVVEVASEPYVVMELLPSRSLASYIGERGTLSQPEAAEIGSAVASALQTAHRAGITHRDVKPGNVLIGENGQIKLTDFGIARNAAEQSMTQTGTVLGSPPYIAPEVAMGRAVGPAADLWGLGATLFACLEGRPPYDAGDPVGTVTEVVHGEVPVPSGRGPVVDVVRGLMVKDPTLRMPLPAVRRRLRPLLSDPEGPVLAAPASPRTAAFRLPPQGAPSDQAGLIPMPGQQPSGPPSGPTPRPPGKGPAGTLVEGSPDQPSPGPRPRTDRRPSPGPRTGPEATPAAAAAAAAAASAPATEETGAPSAEGPGTGEKRSDAGGAPATEAPTPPADGSGEQAAAAPGDGSGGTSAAASGAPAATTGTDTAGATVDTPDAPAPAAATGEPEDAEPAASARARSTAAGTSGDDEDAGADAGRDVEGPDAEQGAGDGDDAAGVGPAAVAAAGAAVVAAGAAGRTTAGDGAEAAETAEAADDGAVADDDDADDAADAATPGGRSASGAGDGTADGAGDGAGDDAGDPMATVERADGVTPDPEDVRADAAAAGSDEGADQTTAGSTGTGTATGTGTGTSSGGTTADAPGKTSVAAAGGAAVTSSDGTADKTTAKTADETGDEAAAKAAAKAAATSSDGAADRAAGDASDDAADAASGTIPDATDGAAGAASATAPGETDGAGDEAPDGTADRVTDPKAGAATGTKGTTGNGAAARVPSPPSDAETTMVGPRVPASEDVTRTVRRPPPPPPRTGPPGRWTPPGGAPAPAWRPAPPRPAAAGTGTGSAQGGTGQPLAADPGPLPFTPSPRPPAPPKRSPWAVAAVVALLVLMAALGAVGAYALTRSLAGQGPLTSTLRPAGPEVANTLLIAHADTDERYSGTGLGFSALVPANWQQFRLEQPGGDIAVRFVSPSAERELRVDRVVGFYPAQRASDYAALLARPASLGVDGSSVGPLEAVGTAAPGREPPQQIVYRTASGPDDRTTWTRLVPSGNDLWVVRLTTPSTDTAGAVDQFRAVADSFAAPPP